MRGSIRCNAIDATRRAGCAPLPRDCLHADGGRGRSKQLPEARVQFGATDFPPEALRVDLAAGGLPAFLQEDEDPIRVFTDLRLSTLITAGGEHMAHAGGGMANPAKRRVDVAGIDGGLEV